MFEGRTIGVGRESVAMSMKKVWSTVPLHLGGLYEEFTQMEGFALGKKKVHLSYKTGQLHLSIYQGMKKRVRVNRSGSLSQ